MKRQEIDPPALIQQNGVRAALLTPPLCTLLPATATKEPSINKVGKLAREFCLVARRE
jgi:hypothetical protein